MSDESILNTKTALDWVRTDVAVLRSEMSADFAELRVHLSSAAALQREHFVNDERNLAAALAVQQAILTRLAASDAVALALKDSSTEKWTRVAAWAALFGVLATFATVMIMWLSYKHPTYADIVPAIPEHVVTQGTP